MPEQFTTGSLDELLRHLESLPSPSLLTDSAGRPIL